MNALLTNNQIAQYNKTKSTKSKLAQSNSIGKETKMHSKSTVQGTRT